MPYNPNVPNEANQVRTSSGDLALMRENFQDLEPVSVSGMRGLSDTNLAAVAANQVAVWNGSAWNPLSFTLSGLVGTLIAALVSGDTIVHNGSNWVNEPYKLSGLRDTAVDSIAVDEGLKWNGTNYVPIDLSSVGAGGGGSFSGKHVMLRLPSGTQSVPDATDHTITGLESVLNEGSWTVDLAAGTVTVLATSLTHVELIGQAQWQGDSVSGQRALWFEVDGALVSGADVRDVVVANGDPAQTVTHRVVSHTVPVAGGEVLRLRVRQDSGAAVDLENTDDNETWFYVRGLTTSGADMQLRQCRLHLASNQSTLDATNHTVTGMTLSENVGGFANLPASGIIEIPSGVNRAQITVGCAWAANVTGRRSVVPLVDGAPIAPDGMRADLPAANVVTASTRLAMTTYKFPVSGGEVVTLRTFQDSGGALNLEPTANRLVFLNVEAFNLTGG